MFQRCDTVFFGPDFGGEALSACFFLEPKIWMNVSVPQKRFLFVFDLLRVLGSAGFSSRCGFCHDFDVCCELENVGSIRKTSLQIVRFPLSIEHCSCA